MGHFAKVCSFCKITGNGLLYGGWWKLLILPFAGHVKGGLTEMWRNVLPPMKLEAFLLVLPIFLVFSGFINVYADMETIPATEYTWQAPKEGSRVHHYIVQVRVNNSELREYRFVPETSILLQFEYGQKYEVRVAAVDEEDRRGGYSAWSIAYSPELDPPGF